MSYGELDARVTRLAERLAPHRGERVAIVAPNVPAGVVALFAAWRAGTVAVPLGARLREYELRRVLSDAEPAALVSLPTHLGYSFRDLLPVLAPTLPSLRESLWLDEGGGLEEQLQHRAPPATARPGSAEAAALLYTSGTTGEPKRVVVSHEREVAGARIEAELLALDPDDACVLAPPIAHAFGLTALLAAIQAGAHTVLVDSTSALGPLLGILSGGPTVLHGTPALFAWLLSAGRDSLSGLRTGFVAGTFCPPDLIAGLDAEGMRVLNLYGMTELGAAASCRPDDPLEARLTTVGAPLPGYEFRVASDVLADGEMGELHVRGPYVSPPEDGRAEDPAASDPDGWFRTGDFGSLDADGRLRVSGRTKEIVHVGGFNVFPSEVEGFLLTHPDVTAAAVVPVPSRRFGEVLQAWVVPRPDSGLEAGDVLRFARPRIAGYKLPYDVRIVPELPLLPSGKPDRAALSTREPETVR